MLGVLRRHPGPFGSRAEAVATVESEGFSPLVAKWMATNVVRADFGWEWCLDPDEMDDYLRDYFRTDAWDVAENPPAGTAIHFVRALGSSVLDAAARERILGAGRDTGRVFLHEVEGGHWVNTENPRALHELLVAGLPATRRGSHRLPTPRRACAAVIPARMQRPPRRCWRGGPFADSQRSADRVSNQ